MTFSEIPGHNSDNLIHQAPEQVGIVIEEITWGKRKIPLSYSGHIRGIHPVRPGHGAVGFESLIERDFVTAVARFDQLESIVSQPVTITYRIGTTRFGYTPDYLVALKGLPMALECLGFEAFTFVECKPDEAVTKDREQIDRDFRALTQALGIQCVLVMKWDMIEGALAVNHA